LHDEQHDRVILLDVRGPTPSVDGTAVRAAHVAAVLALVSVVGSVVLAGPTGADANAYAFLVFIATCAAVGHLIATRRPGHRVGWLLLVVAVCFGLQDVLGRYAVFGLVEDPGSLPGARLALWPQTWLWVPPTAAITVLLPLCFPGGRLLSDRWRPVAWAAVAWVVVVGLVASLTPGDGQLAVGIGSGVENPLGVEALRPWNWVVEQVAPAVLMVLAVAAATSMTVRFRRSDGVERAQISWLAYAVVASLVLLPLAGLLLPSLDVVTSLVFAGIPLAIGVAVLRYRLYDIDVLVNRTLVYVVLSVALLSVYLVVVAAVSAVVVGDGAGPSVTAAGCVAVLAAPLRARAQSAVNRLMYGDREDPRAALSRLGRQLEATLTVDEVLPAAVEAVADSLRSPHVAVEAPLLGGRVAEHGTASPGVPTVRLPLTFAGEALGHLLVQPRPGDVGFSRGDREVLDDLARQVGAAVHGLVQRSAARRLADDLQGSRQRLVVAREDERRRLGRDLHDEIGPRLAGIAMQVDAARAVLSEDPEHAALLLTSVLEQTTAAVDGVRQAAHELRPPALDSLGLVGAIRTHVVTIGHGPVEITVDAPTSLPPLPAAVEIAGYRIVLEALNNVLRHAHATHCVVRMFVDPGEALTVSVIDDGDGTPDERVDGLGLSSMLDRATELGGRCTITGSVHGGTAVVARLPFPHATVFPDRAHGRV
jgi:signal transduction histidine kinase